MRKKENLEADFCTSFALIFVLSRVVSHLALRLFLFQTLQKAFKTCFKKDRCPVIVARVNMSRRETCPDASCPRISRTTPSRVPRDKSYEVLRFMHLNAFSKSFIAFNNTLS